MLITPPNFNMDRTDIHQLTVVDPSARIIGISRTGKDVYVGSVAVIRAEESGDYDRVQPVVIEAETNIKDGVIIHTREAHSLRSA